MMFASIIGAGLGLGVLAAAAGTVAIWLVWLLARRWRSNGPQGSANGFPVIRIALALLLITLPAGCAWVMKPQPQPASLRLVQAVEIELATPADRADLIAILRDHAARNGLHLDDVSQNWVELGRGEIATSPAKKSIYIGVWRTTSDRDFLVGVDDGGHLSRAWITFHQGEFPSQAANLRRELLADIRRRWPEARDLPVTASGGLPLDRDLVLRGRAYTIRPGRVSAYAPTPR